MDVHLSIGDKIVYVVRYREIKIIVKVKVIVSLSTVSYAPCLTWTNVTVCIIFVFVVTRRSLHIHTGKVFYIYPYLFKVVCFVFVITRIMFIF